MRYIDTYCHILPRKYQEALDRLLPSRDPALNTSRYAQSVPTLLDLDARFRLMDRFQDYVQVLTVAAPSVTKIAPPKVAAELAKVANDELAELVYRYPERFVGAVACLPLNDVDAALAEADRAIRDLRLRGVEVYTDVAGKPLDSPEFMPLYEKMADYGLPIFIHPQKEMTEPDYPGEEISKFRVWTKLGWPFATALAMTRLVYGGVLERFPGIRFVTHHCGGAIPYVAGRITWNDDFNEARMGHRDIFLRRNALEYYKQFFFDTAVNGNTAALQCGLAFCGLEQLIFATDMPFDNESGYRLVRETIQSVERLELAAAERLAVYQDNAVRLLRLPVCPL